MDLKTFIEQSLVEIIQGIHEAQGKVKGYSALINPQIQSQLTKDGYLEGNFPRPNREVLERLNLLETATGGVADMVEFDLAITVAKDRSETAAQDGGGKVGLSISVLSAEVGASSKTTSGENYSDTRVSRVKFRIPVMFPRRPL
jgi:hypothetical protein